MHGGHFHRLSPSQAADAAEAEKEEWRDGQLARSPGANDWQTVVPHSDCTPPPEPQTSPHRLVTSGEDNTSFIAISTRPASAADRNQGNATSVNGELQAGGASPNGGNEEPLTASSGGLEPSSSALCSSRMQRVLVLYV